MPTLPQTLDRLRDELIAYIEATYHIRDDGLLNARRQLLAQDGVVAQAPFVEVTPKYVAQGDLFALGPDAPVPEGGRLALQALTREGADELGAPLPRRVFNPPYVHQLDAVRYALGTHPQRRGERRSLVVTTGTGSGKTECFLMPLLSTLAQQAYVERNGHQWSRRAVRALVLYPMNALVNDQLGRTRGWLGDPRIRELLGLWGARPITFARYTGRSPYAGLRRKVLGFGPDGQPLRGASDKILFVNRDAAFYEPSLKGKAAERIKSFKSFYVEHEKRARTASIAQAQLGVALHPEQEHSLRLVRALRRLGKWPAKPNLEDWLGTGEWFDRATGEPRRAQRRAQDSELFSRHEVQLEPPDVLITNYSMLEYMLMRPIERRVFADTRKFYEDFPDERLLLIVDEAHLYRGTSGAEVALLLRRLQRRLGLTPDRVQVILTSASFSSGAHATAFAAELVGKPATDFEPIASMLDLPPAAVGEDAEVLAWLDTLGNVDHALFEDTSRPVEERARAVRAVLQHANPALADDAELERQATAWRAPGGLESALYDALATCPLVRRLRASATYGASERPLLTPHEAGANGTPVDAGRSARPRPLTAVVGEYPGPTLAEAVLPVGTDSAVGERALSAFLSLASAARKGSDALLPTRAHAYFRGLPGLWVCVDARCGRRLHAVDPGLACPECGSRAFPLFTCRDCGVAYARAYTSATADQLEGGVADTVMGASGGFLWAEPGSRRGAVEEDDDGARPLEPVDLLLWDGEDDPRHPCTEFGATREAWLTLDGRLRSSASERARRVLVADIPRARVQPGEAQDDDDETRRPRAVRAGQFYPCPRCLGAGLRSTVQDHITKGVQPFAALVQRQLAVQRAHVPPDETSEERSRRLRFAPLEGRKVLVFSDSRQRAAQLSIDLNGFASRDAARAVLLAGWRELAATRGEKKMSLAVLKAAFIVGENRLGSRIRAPLGAGEDDALLDQRREDWGEIRSQGNPDRDDVMDWSGQCKPTVCPSGWSSIVYSTVAGSGLKVTASGDTRPSKPSARQLNRSQNLTSLALALLAPAFAHLPACRAAVPSQTCPHAALGCERCRDAVLARWLHVVASARGIAGTGCETQTWRDDGVLKVLPANLGRHQALQGQLQRGLPNLAIAPLYESLRKLLTDADGYLDGSKLTLRVPDVASPGADTWALCDRCSTVSPYAPSQGGACPQCGSEYEARPFDLALNEQDLPCSDEPRVRRFMRRKGFYRQPVVDALRRGERLVIPVAAEHTAQVGDAPRGEAFSPAEFHELLFQDVDAGKDHRGRRRGAVDILSSTTTMEVGIDIGSLSGVALRNMPPRRDNYQQRAGRAGRRGDGVATVVGYANTGTHDTYTFEHPRALLSDPVSDPTLSLDNPRVVDRHATATLLQAYAHERLEAPPALPDYMSPQLFEVLGTLSSFLDPTSRISLEGFKRWLKDTGNDCRLAEIAGWAWATRPPEERRAWAEALPARIASKLDDVCWRTYRALEKGDRDGLWLAKAMLERCGYQVRPVIDYLWTGRVGETDWLELKAKIVPPKIESNTSRACHRWHVARAIVAMRNTHGGVVIIGAAEVNNEARVEAVPVLDASGLDGWALRELEPLLGGPAGQPSWEHRPGRAVRLVDGCSLHGVVTCRSGTLDGQPVVLLFVPSASKPEELVYVCRDGTDRRVLPRRSLGDIGRVVEISAPADIEAIIQRTPWRPLHLTSVEARFGRWWTQKQARYGAALPPPFEDGDDRDEDSDIAEDVANAAGSVAEADGDEAESPTAAPDEAPPDPEVPVDVVEAAKSGKMAARASGDPDLLRVLLDGGVLPSYAFPTDVVTFHVIDRTSTDPFRPRYVYQASQGLEQALSQYAPGRMVALDNQTFHVGALYDSSPGQVERRAAYRDRQVYLFCRSCGHYTERDGDRAFAVVDYDRKDNNVPRRQCPLCRADCELGRWVRPTGFLATDVDAGARERESLSYATSAKLVLPTPGAVGEDGMVSDPSVLGGRGQILRGWYAPLVRLNEAPGDKGYVYCTSCGRIEPMSTATPSAWRQHYNQPHAKPFPTTEADRECKPGSIAARLALGYRFLTDVAVLSLDLASAGFQLHPKSPEARSALRSLAQAIALAASERVLKLQEGELEADFRWPSGDAGAVGLSAEIYWYDKVPGGAGYANEAAARLSEVLDAARSVLECPRGCGSSCYSCLRRYRNQLHHQELNRHLALYVLDAVERGAPPEEWAPEAHIQAIALVAQSAIAQLAGTPNSPLFKAWRPGGPEAKLMGVLLGAGERELLLALRRPFCLNDEPSEGGAHAAEITPRSARDSWEELELEKPKTVRHMTISAHDARLNLPAVALQVQREWERT
jgi:ATP-dependent helicase YprA (DUF1998 family)